MKSLTRWCGLAALVCVALSSSLSAQAPARLADYKKEAVKSFLIQEELCFR